ncbi:MAG: hypothetical protein ACI8QS_000896 [Planctomycetota bacterium]|jgi:hypothetical protein
MKTALLSGLAGLVLASAAGAQTDLPQSSFQSFTGPVQRYTLDYATGTLTKDSAVDTAQIGVNAASAVSYQNDCTSGFFTSVPLGEERVDWGLKAGSQSTIVDSFAFAYATDALDPGAAGPGANVDINIYAGTNGFGSLGTLEGAFSFTGLPGSPDGVSIAAFIVTVDLAGGFDFCLPDGQVGYGYCTTDPGSTGPLIIDVNDVNCNGNGVFDGFDVYTCPASTGTYVNTLFFGGSPTASFYMVINEDDGSEVATTVENFGNGTNPVVLGDAGLPPILGTNYAPTVDTGATGHAISACVYYRGSLPPGTLIIGAGEVIVDPTSGNDFSNIVVGTGVNDHSVLVPKELSLVGMNYTVQAIMYGGVPPVLGNALDIHLGF